MRSKSLYFIIALILLGRVHAQFKITEFLARNENSITDEDSEKSDWIEINNTTAEAFNIGGWHLTDNKSILNKWTFPHWMSHPSLD